MVLPPGVTPELRKERLREKQGYRRRWVSLLFYGPVGHALSLLIVVPAFLLALAASAAEEVLDLVRWFIVVHVALAAVLNCWFYRDEIRAAKARERGIHV